MKTPILRASAAVLCLLCCSDKGPQSLIDSWNREFETHRRSCEAGNPQSCQRACQMSQNPTVCTAVEAAVDMTDPEQRAWVAQCAPNAAIQGAAACASAATAEQRPPLVTPPGTTGQGAVEEASRQAEATLAALREQLAAASQEQEEMKDQLKIAQDQAEADVERQAPHQAPPTRFLGGSEQPGEAQASLPKEVIRRVVQNHDGQLRMCYERRLRSEPNLSGRLTVEFAITDTGEVRHAAISGSTISDPTIETCVTAVFRRMRFPSPRGGREVIVTYPILFTPSDK